MRWLVSNSKSQTSPASQARALESGEPEVHTDAGKAELSHGTRTITCTVLGLQTAKCIRRDQACITSTVHTDEDRRGLHFAVSRSLCSHGDCGLSSSKVAMICQKSVYTAS